MSIVDESKPELDKAIEHLKGELNALRTGRANPALIENILVISYGVKTPLQQLSSINLADSKSLTVEPWDKNLLKDIEKAIVEVNLGLTTANEGNFIRVTIPPMTEESRKELVKLLKEKSEKTRIAIRMIRDKIKEQIGEQEKNKEIGEDERYRLQKNLDELTGKYNDQVKEILENKEKEMMTV